QVDRLSDRIEALASDKRYSAADVDRVLEFIAEFWAPYSAAAGKTQNPQGAAGPAERAKQRIPPIPAIADILDPPDNQPDPEYRRITNAMLPSMAEYLAAWKKPPLPLPDLVVKASKKLADGLADT